MNSIGIGVVRNVDELGRIVIPRELRGTLEILTKTSLVGLNKMHMNLIKL